MRPGWDGCACGMAPMPHRMPVWGSTHVRMSSTPMGMSSIPGHAWRPQPQVISGVRPPRTGPSSQSNAKERSSQTVSGYPSRDWTRRNSARRVGGLPPWNSTLGLNAPAPRGTISSHSPHFGRTRVTATDGRRTDIGCFARSPFDGSMAASPVVNDTRERKCESLHTNAQLRVGACASC